MRNILMTVMMLITVTGENPLIIKGILGDGIHVCSQFDHFAQKSGKFFGGFFLHCLCYMKIH
ncbi:hypothetical protein PAAL109150_14345 [Paenibacillus alkaliterrae]